MMRITLRELRKLVKEVSTATYGGADTTNPSSLNTAMEEEYIGFDKLVSKLKKQGRSEESAKAIAASIGRKKYGKKNFQQHAAQGKKMRGAQQVESVIRKTVREALQEWIRPGVVPNPSVFNPDAMTVPEMTVKLEELLKDMDWYYELSDAGATYQRGKERMDAITLLRRKLPKEIGDALYQKYAPKHR